MNRNLAAALTAAAVAIGAGAALGVADRTHEDHYPTATVAELAALGEGQDCVRLAEQPGTAGLWAVADRLVSEAWDSMTIDTHTALGAASVIAREQCSRGWGNDQQTDHARITGQNEEE